MPAINSSLKFSVGGISITVWSFGSSRAAHNLFRAEINMCARGIHERIQSNSIVLERISCDAAVRLAPARLSSCA